MEFYWIITMAVLFLIEAVTMNFLTMWFSAGALLTAIFSMFVDNIVAQLGFFVITSALFLLLAKPIFDKQNRRVKIKTNCDQILGQIGEVTTTIHPIENGGRVYVDGTSWSAKAKNGEIIEQDAIVKVLEIKGVTLIVEKTDMKV